MLVTDPIIRQNDQEKSWQNNGRSATTKYDDQWLSRIAKTSFPKVRIPRRPGVRPYEDQNCDREINTPNITHNACDDQASDDTPEYRARDNYKRKKSTSAITRLRRPEEWRPEERRSKCDYEIDSLCRTQDCDDPHRDQQVDPPSATLMIATVKSTHYLRRLWLRPWNWHRMWLRIAIIIASDREQPHVRGTRLRQLNSPVLRP